MTGYIGGEAACNDAGIEAYQFPILSADFSMVLLLLLMHQLYPSTK